MYKCLFVLGFYLYCAYWNKEWYSKSTVHSVSQKNKFGHGWKLRSKNWKIGSEWIGRRCEFHSRIMTVSNRDSSGFWKYKFKSPNKSGGYSGEQVRW